MSCPPGTILNPESLHCVKIAGRKGRLLIRDPSQLAQIPVKQQELIPGVCKSWQVKNPFTDRCIKRTGRTFKRVKERLMKRQQSNKPSVIPTGPPDAVRAWLDTCRNPREVRDSKDTVVRLHTGTCVPAQQLHARVATEHHAGVAARVPGGGGERMTIDDFRVLKEAQRRRNATYRVPRLAAAAAAWQLQAVQLDSEFVSVSFVDPTGTRPARLVGAVPKNHPRTRELLVLLRQRPNTAIASPWRRAMWGPTPGSDRDAVMARLIQKMRQAPNNR